MGNTAQAPVAAQNTQERRQNFSAAMETSAYKNLIAQTIPDEKQRNRFKASILSAVAVNPALRECTAGTILAAAFLGESLGLSPSPQLGQYYMVPFENKIKDANGKPVYKKDANGNTLTEKGRDGNEYPIAETEKHAVFVLGYKGYIQMAIRSGMYKNIIVEPIKEGELVSYNSITEETVLKPITDPIKREAAKTVGYYAKIILVGGFEKETYWSKEKMMVHADRYSNAYSMAADLKLKEGQIPKSELWKYSSFWYKDFDAMACKTMIRQIVSKWGILSQELADGYTRDNAVIQQDGTYEVAEIELADGDRVQGPDEAGNGAQGEAPPAEKPAGGPKAETPPQGAAETGKPGEGENLTFDDI